ncbi:hypothetical protein [Rothia endophytica]|uniref:hypothetical protein n=1 Tax=Rothia endophytica TaxID=1324766 RepID=UPI001F3E6A3B|nr:hypothetical protein [Rothia endophytica]
MSHLKQRLPFLALIPLLLFGCSQAPQSEVTESATSAPSQTRNTTVTPTPTVADTSEAEHDEQTSIKTPSPTADPTAPAQDGYTIDPSSIATTEIVTGDPASTDAYIYAEADQPALVFQTPDPQVACLMQPYGVFCMTDDSLNWVLLSVSMKPGDEAPRSIQAQGRAATHPWFKTETVLPEGQSLSWMGMTCTSTGSNSVQCHDGTRGFNLSDANGR